jgi:GNAT superfamily N-acetyltransferase
MNMFTANSTLTNNLAVNLSPQTGLIIRPVEESDVDLILDMHHRLSMESLYNRYHSHRIPTRAEIEKICTLSAENGRAVVAAIPGKQSGVVGMAYYIQSSKTAAETAFLVEDRFQGQGIGKGLIQALAQLAVKNGILFFDANVLSSNKTMLHLLNQAGHMVHYEYDYGSLDMRVQLAGISG